MEKFSLFTKVLLSLWSACMFILIGAAIYGGFYYGTASWLWRPSTITGTRTYIERGIQIKEDYKIEIR